MTALISRDRFLNLHGVTYLYTGAEAPALRAHVEALERYQTEKGRGEAGREPGGCRWEVGFPSYPSSSTLNASLDELLSIESSVIEEHILALGDRLLHGLLEQGWPVMTSVEGRERGGNIAFLEERPELLASELARRGIHVWGGDGRIRCSVHAFNDNDDVEALLAALQNWAGR